MWKLKNKKMKLKIKSPVKKLKRNLGQLRHLRPPEDGKHLLKHVGVNLEYTNKNPLAP
jgi:hypothetical protein